MVPARFGILYIKTEWRRRKSATRSISARDMMRRARVAGCRDFCTGAVLALAVLPAGLAAGEWPGWRGPRGDGTADETRAPVRWSASENVRWKTPIPGKGH